MLLPQRAKLWSFREPLFSVLSFPYHQIERLT